MIQRGTIGLHLKPQSQNRANNFFVLLVVPKFLPMMKSVVAAITYLGAEKASSTEKREKITSTH